MTAATARTDGHGPIFLASGCETANAPRPPDVVAAVQAALDNVRRHAGEGARVWILLEAEGAGRLGVAQSMPGRIADLGGATTIHSTPGQGTEVEFWVPRR